MSAKFYAIKGSGTSDQQSFFGAFYPLSASSVPAQNVNPIIAYTRRSGGAQSAAIRAGRFGKFPGVYSPPQPARAWFTVAAFAGITNHATFTLDDGVNPAQIFEYIKSGSPTAGNVPIAIAGLVTAAQVAAATVAAINNFTTVTQADPLGGWFATTPAGKPTDFIILVQSGTGSPPNASRSFWAATTYGMLGNTNITVGAGSGLTAVHNFTGGTRGASGVTAQFVYPGRPWVLAEGGYTAVPKGD